MYLIFQAKLLFGIEQISNRFILPKEFRKNLPKLPSVRKNANSTEAKAWAQSMHVFHQEYSPEAGGRVERGSSNHTLQRRATVGPR